MNGDDVSRDPVNAGLTSAPIAAVRACIAHELLRDECRVAATLGSVTLRDDQQRCAERVVEAMAEYGGALIANPVGVGKTYIALGVAQCFREVLILAPAGLRDMWHDALARTQSTAAVMTHEALSAGTHARVRSDLVIIDEAHRLRSMDTRRYAAAADLCRGANVLLVTATPVQNRMEDLRAQLGLFLGTAAWTCDEEQLARHVIRDAWSAGDSALPRLDGPHPVELPHDDDLLDEILALPAAVPAADEGVAHSLARFGLVHQWASSRAALRAALERRRTRGLALLSALESGRLPTRDELAAWTASDGALQLAFPQIVMTADVGETSSVASLSSSVRNHLEAVDRLLRRVRADSSLDAARAAVLRDVRARHHGERVIAFSQYAETVTTLYRLLAPGGGVAVLNARGARIVTGRVSRREVLAQFTGDVEGSCDTHPAQRIDLLLATDLLSEGLNLQRASVIVHLDMPWNPARLDQRVGRARRLGAHHDVVSVYMIAPPAESDRLLELERRLREKLARAHGTVGVAGRILPSVFNASSSPDLPLAEQRSLVHARIAEWRRRARDGPPSCTPCVAAARSDRSGFLALVRTPRSPMLVADTGRGVNATTRAVLDAVDLAGGAEAAVDPDELRAALASLMEWLQLQRGRSMVDLGAAASARARRGALARVARTLARTPRQRLPLLAPLARQVRAVATAPMGAGAERILETLVRAELPDEAWLRAVATFGEMNAANRAEIVTGDEIVAVVLFRRA